MIKHYYFVAFSLQSAWGQIEIGHLFLKCTAGDLHYEIEKRKPQGKTLTVTSITKLD